MTLKPSSFEKPLIAIPPATASFFARRPGEMAAISIRLCALFTWTGLGLSLCTGPCIILFAGWVYLGLLGIHKINPGKQIK